MEPTTNYDNESTNACGGVLMLRHSKLDLESMWYKPVDLGAVRFVFLAYYLVLV